LPLLNGFTDTDAALADRLPLWDQSANANRDTRADYLLGLVRISPGGRLTLTAGTPVTIVDTPGSTLYYTPHEHDLIVLWDGTRWVSVTFVETALVTLAAARTTATMGCTLGSPNISNISVGTGAIQPGDPITSPQFPAGTTVVSVAGSNGTLSANATASASAPSGSITFYHATYDVFGYLSAGNLALEILGWTNNNTRATDVTIQDGRHCKSGDRTRLYLGSYRLTSSTSTVDSEAVRFLWNCYNRRPRKLRKQIVPSSWVYAVGAWRPVANDAAHRIDVVLGLVVEPIRLFCAMKGDCASAVSRYTGISIDQTGSWANNFDVTEAAQQAGPEVCNSHLVYTAATPGWHWFTQLELVGASSTQFGPEYGILGEMWA
jgi:hypothetical protein